MGTALGTLSFAASSGDVVVQGAPDVTAGFATLVLEPATLATLACIVNPALITLSDCNGTTELF